MKNKSLIYPFFIVLAAVLWGLDGVILRPALYTMSVPVLVFLEHAIAFAIMIPFLIYERKKLKKLDKKTYLSFFLVALLGGSLGTIFIVKGLFYVNFAHLSAVILMQKLQPIFAIFLAWLILKERMPKKFFIFAGLAFIGAYMIAFPGLRPDFNTGDKTSIAAMFGLLAALCWGASTVVSKYGLKNTDPRIGTYLRYGFTTLIMLVIMLSTGTQSKILEVTSTQWNYILIIIFSSGMAAMFLYYYGLKKVKASVSTICELGLPLSAIILEYFVHGKLMNFTQFIGTAILLISIIIIARMKEAVS